MSDLWHRTNAIFLEALGLDQHQRAEFLKEACPSPQLCAEVVAMLAAYDQSQQFLQQPALFSIPTWHAAIGSELGAYRIEREIGRGGMAVVFQAARSDGVFQKKVAIKFLLSPLPSEFSLKRFSQERQLLARLDHPHIAQLLDGGHTREGYPYLVMEYIEGQTLLEYCESRALDLTQRLHLFLKICKGVHYIHQHLIVHRDLKPGNILVDPRGEPKILDFGIAKLLGTEVLGHGLTQEMTSRPLMTPEYASPEQIRQKQITTAADTYALGVLLYRLLSGQMPYVAEGQSPGAWERKICGEDPPPPSQAAKTTQRSNEMPPWRKQLPRDFDYIIAKAMRKDPGQRYPSVQAFSEDISRYLNGFPVNARKGHFGYRASKFFSRHATAVGLSATLCLLLIVGVSAFVRQSQVTALERDRFQRLNHFLLSIFDFADPMKPQGSNPTAKELMAKASENVRQELRDDPLVRASMLASLGQIHHRLGSFPQAKNMLEEAYDLQQEHLGPREPELMKTALTLARFRMFVGDLEGAEAVLAKNESHFARSHRAGGALEGEFWLVSGKLALTKNDNSLAEARLSKAFSLLHDEDHLLTKAEVAGDLGTLHFQKGSIEVAAGYFEQALTLSKQVLGEDHPQVAKAMSNLAPIYGEFGAYEKVIELLKKARGIAQKNFGPNHPYAAIPEHNLALAYAHLGNYPLALQSMKKALASRELAFGQDHRQVAETGLALGRLYFQLGNLEMAEHHTGCSLQVFQRILPPDHVMIGQAALLLAEIYQQTGNLKQARQQCNQSIAILQEKLKPDHHNLKHAQKMSRMLGGSDP